MGDFFLFSHRQVKILGGLLVLLFFSQSCQHHDEGASISSSIHVDNAIGQSFQNMTFMPNEWIEENWWEMFDDPQLSGFITQSFTQNPSLQMAVERVGIARDCSKQAFAPMLPKVDAAFEEFFAGFTWNSRGIDGDAVMIPDRIVPGWINILSTLLNFRWSLDLWGKQRNLYKAAIDESKMQMAEAAYVKLMLSTQIAQAYFDLQYYSVVQDLQTDIEKTLNELLCLQRQIFNYDLIDQETLNLQEKQILNIQKDLLSTDEKILLAKRQIQTLMGLSADNSMEIENPKSYFKEQFPFPSEIPVNLLLRRPDVVAKIWTVQAAARRVKSAKASFLPSIDLGSFSGYLKLNWDTLLKPRGWFSSIAPMAALPIFRGLELRANLSLSARRYNLAVYEYNQILLNAAKEVVDAISAFRLSNQTGEKQLALFEKSEQIFQLSTQRYDAGLNSLVDVLESKIRVIQDELQCAAVEHMHLLSALNLIKALGGGYRSIDAETLQEEMSQ